MGTVKEQLHSIPGATPFLLLEGNLYLLLRMEVDGPDTIVVCGVPADGSGTVIKQASIIHQNLAVTAFFCRASVKAYSAGHLIGLKVVFVGNGRSNSSRT